jgi:alkylhydroperoxidase family enzyme
MHIRWVEEDEADGLVAEVYRAWRAANPERDAVPGILKCLSLRPDLLKAMVDLTYPLHFADGHLTRRTKEMIGTLVSGLNQCLY